MSERRALVMSAVRSPVARHHGALSGVRVDDLAAVIIREAASRAEVKPEILDEVICGTVNASGEAMGNLARFAALLAGFPSSVAGITVNRYCGSGLSAVNQLARGVVFGDVRAGVAAGAESMSRSTWPVPIPSYTKTAGPLVGRNAMWSGAGGPQNPVLEADGTMVEMSDAAQYIARELKISRMEMDEYAVESHRRAAIARDAGFFAEEIVPVMLPDGSIFSVDETIRPNTNLDMLAKLDPFNTACPDLTAGNTCPANDGASAMVIVGQDVADETGLPPLGEFVASTEVGVEPIRFALGPVVAIQKLLTRTGLTVADIDLFEINEAFSVQMVACIRELNLNPDIVNVNGGALALGHALGNSGVRTSVTLLHEMRRRDARYGIVALCVGGGQGVATLFKRGK
jgi:acetyl-CoA acetyltransferase family protein